MFGGHAPPFGWYWSASRSRASAPSSSAICVTSPVAPGWFVDSSPRSCASLKQRPPAASTTVPASTTCSPQTARQPFSRRSSERSGLFVSAVPVPASNASRKRLRDRVAGAVADLEQALARRAAAAREPVAAVLARELDAELLEPVDRGRRLRREHRDERAGRRSRGSTSRRPRRAARASRRRRTPPGCRPAPSRSCTTGAIPSPRARRVRPRARPRRRRRDRRRRCRSRARRRTRARPRRAILPNSTDKIPLIREARAAAAAAAAFSSASSDGSHSSQRGRYQFQSPRSFIAAGSSTARTIVASRNTATASPNPSCLTGSSRTSRRARRRRP